MAKRRPKRKLVPTCAAGRRLERLRVELGMSRAALYRAVPISNQCYAKYLEGGSPIHKNGHCVTEAARKLADFHGVGVSMIWPEVDAMGHVDGEVSRRIEDHTGDPELAAMAESERSAIRRALAMLTTRQERVLRLRYGFVDGGDGLTLDEAAALFSVTRERIRQIESKGLRKLRIPRHPVDVTPLQHLVDPDALDPADRRRPGPVSHSTPIGLWWPTPFPERPKPKPVRKPVPRVDLDRYLPPLAVEAALELLHGGYVDHCRCQVKGCTARGDFNGAISMSRAMRECRIRGWDVDPQTVLCPRHASERKVVEQLKEIVCGGRPQRQWRVDEASARTRSYPSRSAHC